MATVIKFSPHEFDTEPSVMSFGEMLPDVERSATQRDAAQIIEEAEQEARAIISRAQEAGRQAGASAQQEVIDQQIAHKMQLLDPLVHQLAAEISQAKHSWLAGWDRSALQLAIKIAQRIIRREVNRFPEIKADLLREALEMCAAAGHLKIHLNPADAADPAVTREIQRVAQKMGDTVRIDTISDPQISPGGCRVETQHGAVDQQIESQLDRITAELI
jgi:flagellar assembly protein FliH